MATIAERLTELLMLRDMSAADLARITDIPESAISNYKKGNYEPKQRRIEAIAAALHVSPGYLMGMDDTPPAQSAPPIPGFDELTEENKKAVEKYIDFLLSKQ